MSDEQFASEIREAVMELNRLLRDARDRNLLVSIDIREEHIMGADPLTMIDLYAIYRNIL